MNIKIKPKLKSQAKTRWTEGAIVYQIYPRSFFDSNKDGIGDIPGITKKLDYLKDLGINAVWLSPFYTSPMADFGYDVADYCDVDPIFGKLSDMDDLIEEAHSRGIKIMVDLVPNHTSDEHPWFEQSRQSKEDPYSDWYIWRDPRGHDKHGKPVPPNNWLGMFSGESAWEWEPARQQFYLHTFDVRQPDLNWSNPAVREAIKDVMRFWLDKGVDGFRVDAVIYLGKDPLLKDEPKNPHFNPENHKNYESLKHVNDHGWPQMYAYLSELANVLKENKYRGMDKFMVTEGYPDTHEPIEEYLAFYEGMDEEVAAPFNFEGLSLPWNAQAWGKYLTSFHTALNNLSDRCVASYAFGNHDQPRLASRLGEDKARSAAVLLLTLPGMAFIYNGDEIGMKNVKIPLDMVQDPGAVGGEGRDPERTPLQWTPGKNAGFSEAESTWLPLSKDYKKLNIETELKDPHSFLSLYIKLGRLRNHSPSLKHGGIEVLESGHKDVLCFSRTDKSTNHKNIVMVNFSAEAVAFKPQVKTAGFILSSSPETKLEKSGNVRIHLAPHEAAIFTA